VSVAPRALESAITRLESIGDAEAIAAAREAVSAVLALHGEGLRRLCERLRESGDGDQALRQAAQDEVIASVLALHDLHPLSVEERVRRAVDGACAGAPGCSAEVLSIDDGGVRLRLTGSPGLRRSVMQAIEQAAPELAIIEVVQDEPMATAAVAAAPQHPERCHLCSAPLSEEHEHLLDSRDRRLECTCTACALLFDIPSAKVRRVRRRARLLAGFRISEAQWAALEVPVGLAFFTYSSAMGEVVAAYPGPAGPIESLVPQHAWAELVRHNPVLAELEPDTCALLAVRLRGKTAYHILSIDQCYRLSALVRRSWQGITGGDGPMRAVEDFFAQTPQGDA